MLANLVLLELHPIHLLSPLTEFFLSLKKEEKHTIASDISNSAGMHLLIGYVDLLSTTRKMVFDGMLLVQKDPTLGIPTLLRFLGIFLEILAIRSSLGIFWKPNLP